MSVHVFAVAKSLSIFNLFVLKNPQVSVLPMCQTTAASTSLAKAVDFDFALNVEFSVLASSITVEIYWDMPNLLHKAYM